MKNLKKNVYFKDKLAADCQKPPFWPFFAILVKANIFIAANIFMAVTVYKTPKKSL